MHYEQEHKIPSRQEASNLIKDAISVKPTLMNYIRVSIGSKILLPKDCNTWLVSRTEAEPLHM